MNLTSTAATERPADRPRTTDPSHPPPSPIQFTKATVQMDDSGKELEVFKMAFGAESILLLPLRSWGQLDLHKWVARGRLPNTPGLEVTPDHVRLAGQTVSIQDPDGCAKLKDLFAAWLALEQETLALARRKAAAKAVPAAKEVASASLPTLQFKVEVGAGAQVHIRCVQGKETLATIGLNAAGFKSLFTQGLMRKPHALQSGALHDWVELDGQLFSFEKGNNDAARLEKALNEHYLPMLAPGQGKDVVVFTNAASSTGFDIQFPVKVGGVPDRRRRPLNEESLDLLQDQDRCGLLHKGVVIKLSRPTLIFKQKTPDGGENYLPHSPDSLVYATDEDGRETVIDLSRPVNYSRLSTAELTAVFNHPALHKHGKVTTRPNGQGSSEPSQTVPAAVPPPAKPAACDLALPPGPFQGSLSAGPPPSPSPGEPMMREPLPAPSPEPPAGPAPPPPLVPSTVSAPLEVSAPPPSAETGPAPVLPIDLATQPREPEPGPNAWLADALAQPVAHHEWFARLVYSRIAERLNNSFTVKLGLSDCWATALSETTELSHPDFKGFFLTEKGGFGFVGGGRLARFNAAVAFLGTQEQALEGIGVSLLAVALDQARRAYFIVTPEYRSLFDVPAPAIARELALLQERGVVILSLSEALAEPQPLEILWTVPAELEQSGEPELVEFTRPAIAEAA